jgi:MSHA pilin protein MshA
MRTQQAGFTLIELIVVIVILGILGAIAVPKFVDLSSDAGDAAAKATAGALGSASTLNYGKKSLGTGGAAITATTTCADLPAILMANGMISSDANISFAAPAMRLDFGGATLGAGDTACSGANTISTACKVKHTNGATTAGFPAYVVCTG